MGLLDHMVLVFWGNSILFSIEVVPVYIPTSSVRESPFLHTLSNIYCLLTLMMAILTGVRWSLIVLFFFFFLMTAPMAYGGSWGQGLNLSSRSKLCHSCGNTGSFNPRLWARDQTHTSVATWAFEVVFLIHCTTAGTPLIVVLICISVMLTFCGFWPSIYLWKNVYRSSAHFFFDWVFCFFLILSFMSCLYILQINPLLHLQIFCPILWVALCFVSGFLYCAKTFKFN